MFDSTLSATINTMDIFTAVVMFWFGSIFGSFAGAMAWRIKKKRDFVRDRSECEHCHKKLTPLDLIPVISWIVLRGKCRYCKKHIGTSTFLIELFLGGAFAASYLAWPFGFGEILSVIMFGLWLICLVLMAVLFVYDLRWSLLSDKVMWPLIAVAALLFVVRMLWLEAPALTIFYEFIYGLLPVTGIYGLLYLISQGKWIGLGDVKLGVAMGLMLGWQLALVALVVANLLGFLYVLPLLLAKKVERTSRLPFGPFLIVATVVAMLFGNQLIALYLRLLVV